MSHDESTYLDEGRDYLDPRGDSEGGPLVPLETQEGPRWGHLDEEAWGGWSVVE